ncbi:MAG: hypothetical protein Q4B95_07165 [Lonepinella koalarum]|nr:hypothetical protein [Lonepinella koalarum]
MKKLIIVRGHSGSGKTTFALNKISEFLQQYPQADIFHIENDHFLMENGQYCWTEERFKRAKKLAWEKLQKAFHIVEKSSRDILIIISNVGVNVAEIDRTLARAKALNMQTEIYRMTNFFQNQHNVPVEIVQSMYQSLCEYPIKGEIIISHYT